ncbi:MAG: hypothetical protein H7327_09200, partial [Herminiimonas sp.]|nr:hypothetical protein [Herminiimonas sp.]
MSSLLGACGGSGTDGGTAAAISVAADVVVAPTATATTTIQIDVATLPDAAAAQMARPTFHVAPVILEEPSDIDRVDATASAQSAPRRQIVPAEFDGMSTRGLTMPAMKAVRR